jgi:hypothetical protein
LVLLVFGFLLTAAAAELELVSLSIAISHRNPHQIAAILPSLDARVLTPNVQLIHKSDTSPQSEIIHQEYEAIHDANVTNCSNGGKYNMADSLSRFPLCSSAELEYMM